ncbi:hypothetical protein LUZ61_012330 [Rhynchospora tenuis]|uniref:4-coumarate--CoA ligase n=1 Tax=Rhynchospora tenuis TaxID=198213 RepID=A0AAD6F1B3_9POAL|nr:hypothetical protein LUZ61_012330 [Rhynchospora tenuis]
MGSHVPEDSTIYRSVLPDIEIPNHLPLHSYCFEHLDEYADRPCLIDGLTNTIYSYLDVDRLSRYTAANFRRLGIRKGDVIMNLLRNSVEFAFSFLGASRLGAATTTANPFYTPAEIHKQASAAGAKIIITEMCAVEKIKDFAAEHDIYVIITDGHVDGYMHFSELIKEDTPQFEDLDSEIEPDDVVALPYSSGTTGLPKGVMLTHRSLVTSVSQQVDGENPNWYLHKDDVIFCVLPLFHIYSLNSILLCGLRVGAAILMVKKFDLVGFMGLVQKYHVTIAPIVPPIVVEIAKSPEVEGYDLSSIRFIQSGAAPMGKEIQEAFKAKLPNAVFGQGYGMTEAGPVLALCLSFAKEPYPVKSGSCGTVVRNAQMKIIDPETGASLGRNKPGEICIRGQQIMKGYLNDPESTKNTIDREGWLHTGDVGFVDDDGEIFIVDRLKEIIKYKGFQVAPAEIEALLLTHPAIADAAVIPMKDELAGEIPVAFVVRSNGTQVTEDEIKQFVSKQVIFYKRINKVFFTEAIPKNPSGKILRKDLRAKLAALTS